MAQYYPFIENVPRDFWLKLSEKERSDFRDIYVKIHQKMENVQTMNSISSLNSDFRIIGEYLSAPPDSTRDARAICCGLFFAQNAILINTKQAKVLLSRSKSSINTILQHMGYNSGRNGVKRLLLLCIPSLTNYPELIRQWTTRSLATPSQMPNTPTPLPTQPNQTFNGDSQNLQFSHPLEPKQPPPQHTSSSSAVQQLHRNLSYESPQIAAAVAAFAQLQQSVQQNAKQSTPQSAPQNLQPKQPTPTPTPAKPYTIDLSVGHYSSMIPFEQYSFPEQGFYSMSQGYFYQDQLQEFATSDSSTDINSETSENIVPIVLPKTKTEYISYNYRFFMPKINTLEQYSFSPPSYGF